MADFGHFEFAALTDLAGTFARWIEAKFFIYTLKKTNPLRNDPLLSKVTDLMSMTQLIGCHIGFMQISEDNHSCKCYNHVCLLQKHSILVI